MPRRRTAPLTALALSLVLALGACGSEDTDAGGSPQSTSSPTPTDTSEEPTASGDAEDAGTSIRLERAGDAFTPSGARVEVPAGEPFTLEIEADEAGELHVHSTPEQEIAYDAGSSTHEVMIERPGVVEVESHEPHLVVLQLEAR